MSYEVLRALALTIYLLGAAVVDLRTQRVPNWYTAPVLVAAGAAALLAGQWSFVPFWLVLYLLWSRHLFGGGDAKLLMLFFAVYPTGAAVIVLCLVLVITLTPVVTWRHWRHWRTIIPTLTTRVLTRDLLPSAEELERGTPITWALALGGITYVWVAF